MRDSLVTIGRVGAPHGVRGELKLQLFLENPADVRVFSRFYLQKPGQSRFEPFQDFELSEKGELTLIHFNGIQDRDIARQFTHALLAIPQEDLPTLDPDEFYWSDLEGLMVVDSQGKELGVVDHLMETGANDVLVVRQGTKEILIPYVVPEIVKKVDLSNRTILVDWA